MRDKLLVIGAGGHGRVVADAAGYDDRWESIAFVDDRFPALMESGGYSVLGGLEGLNTLNTDWSHAVVAIGDNGLRIEKQLHLETLGFQIATVVHPSAQISRDAIIGKGTVIFANVVVNPGARVGLGVILNTLCSVDHDTRIGDAVHISPGAHLAGNVTIGDRSWLGVGASVINNCAIGADVIVGAGAVVIGNVDAGLTVAGVPAVSVK